MKGKKLALAAAIAGTLGASVSANATIIGVPSEGLLVPLGMQGVNEEGYIAVFTGVLIETPALVGADTIINDYTAPNTTKGGYTPPEDKGLWDGGMTVHYYMFDEKSEHVYDSMFYMSPDDVYFWTPPCSIFNYGEGECGSKNWVGYVVFADEAARKGGPATFVMTGQAGIAYATVDTDDIIDVPVVPLADGDDAGGIRIGNEITYSPQQLPRIQDVVPLVAGTRYYGAPGTTTTIVTGLIPIGYNDADIMSVSHVMWLSENGMHADMDFCDDEEWCVSCTDWTFNEVNILTYNIVFDSNNEIPIGPQPWETLMFDGVDVFKKQVSFQIPEDCTIDSPNYPACMYPSITPVGDTCGVMGGYYYPTVMPTANGMDIGHYPGFGMAFYEFASKAGVAGINFQIGVSQQIRRAGGGGNTEALPLGFGDSYVTHSMLSNGQF